MEKIEINGTQIPLLEPPERDTHVPRDILYVLFKRKRLIAVTFLLISLPVIVYNLLQPAQYIAVSKVLIQPARAYLNMSPTS